MTRSSSGSTTRRAHDLSARPPSSSSRRSRGSSTEPARLQARDASPGGARSGSRLLSLLRRRGLPPERLLLFAWNPLVLVESYGSGHIDLWTAAFLLMALALLEPGGARSAGVAFGPRRPRPSIRLSSWLPYLARRDAWALPGGCRRGSALLYVPVRWSAGPSLGTGLATYARHWEFNGSLYPLLRAAAAREIARPGSRSPPPWRQRCSRSPARAGSRARRRARALSRRTCSRAHRYPVVPRARWSRSCRSTRARRSSPSRGSWRSRTRRSSAITRLDVDAPGLDPVGRVRRRRAGGGRAAAWIGAPAWRLRSGAIAWSKRERPHVEESREIEREERERRVEARLGQGHHRPDEVAGERQLERARHGAHGRAVAACSATTGRSRARSGTWACGGRCPPGRARLPARRACCSPRARCPAESTKGNVAELAPPVRGAISAARSAK